MPKLIVDGQEVEYSGNWAEAVSVHPKTMPLSDEDRIYRNQAHKRKLAALQAQREAAAAEAENNVPGVTLTDSDEAKYNDLKYTYSGVSGSVLNSGTVFHNNIHTDYGVWEYDNGDGTWYVIYSDGNWWTAGTTSTDPASWEKNTNPDISDRDMLHWWGNGAHTVEETSGKYGPKDGVTWS